MANHSILIGARPSLFAALQDTAQFEGKRYSHIHIIEQLRITSSTTTLDLLTPGALSSFPTELVIEGLEGVTDESVGELVDELILWTRANRDLETTIYWDLVDLNPESIQRLTEKLLPLVQLG